MQQPLLTLKPKWPTAILHVLELSSAGEVLFRRRIVKPGQQTSNAPSRSTVDRSANQIGLRWLRTPALCPNLDDSDRLTQQNVHRTCRIASFVIGGLLSHHVNTGGVESMGA
jgi:hypothetical protein